ncbi:hypothetical protein C480_04079 [Natrialba aegyptia DSM 13077]|uniref:Uncharacterized protein n=1 Tax=Natrialba aegyptia DSM 13077 TaxID=1227491 RepID=M0BCJ9_9EURY|nr:hypothetical protein C480_04079 [Natrialba aegyptia DSM 13077]
MGFGGLVTRLDGCSVPPHRYNVHPADFSTAGSELDSLIRGPSTALSASVPNPPTLNSAGARLNRAAGQLRQ